MEATSENPSPGKVFSWIERIGNKVPNPFLLFVYLILVLMVATAIISSFDLAVKNPTNGEMVRVNNLMSIAGLQWILPNIIKNFSNLPRWARFWRWLSAPVWRRRWGCCRR